MIGLLLVNVIFALLGLFLVFVSTTEIGEIVGIIVICCMFVIHIFEFILFVISNYKKENKK